jgi:uncharacterized protein
VSKTRAVEKQSMTLGNPVRWFEIYARDMARARKFYETVLGLQLEQLEQSGGSLEDMWVFPMQRDGAGATGALVKMEGAPIGPGGTIVYFASDDCAREAERAKANGGRIVKDKFSIGQYGFIALVADPDDNIIGIHSMS